MIKSIHGILPQEDGEGNIFFALRGLYCGEPWTSLKKLFISYHPHHKKKPPGWPVKLFFTLFKLNITFFFKCYLYHNGSINLNWNNKQLYSSPKPLHNVHGFVFWFVNFCFLSFLHRTSIQKWKKNWFCYVHK